MYSSRKLFLHKRKAAVQDSDVLVRLEKKMKKKKQKKNIPMQYTKKKKKKKKKRKTFQCNIQRFFSEGKKNENFIGGKMIFLIFCSKH